MSVFWNKYNKICEERNVRPRKIAAEIGVADATVTRWKNGSIPRKETIKELSKILQVPVMYFYDDDDVDEFENILRIVKTRKNIKKLVELCNELNDSQIDILFLHIAQIKIKKIEEEYEKTKAQILLECNVKVKKGEE